MAGLISIAELSEIIDSASVEQAFGKYMGLLDSELWDFSALPTVFEKGAEVEA